MPTDGLPGVPHKEKKILSQTPGAPSYKPLWHEKSLSLCHALGYKLKYEAISALKKLKMRQRPEGSRRNSRKSLLTPRAAHWPALSKSHKGRVSLGPRQMTKWPLKLERLWSYSQPWEGRAQALPQISKQRTGPQRRSRGKSPFFISLASKGLVQNRFDYC